MPRRSSENPWSAQGKKSMSDFVRTGFGACKSDSFHSEDARERKSIRGEATAFGSFGRKAFEPKKTETYKFGVAEVKPNARDEYKKPSGFGRKFAESEDDSATPLVNYRFNGFSNFGDKDNASPKSKVLKTHRTSRSRSSRKRYEKTGCFDCGSLNHYSKTCPKKGIMTEPRDSPSELKETYYNAYNYPTPVSPSQNINKQSNDVIANCLDEVERSMRIETDNNNRRNDGNSPVKRMDETISSPPPFNSLRSAKETDHTMNNWGSQHATARDMTELSEDPFAYQTIETRRTIRNRNGQETEEYTFIRFPVSLPPNVKVIAAHMLPAQL